MIELSEKAKSKAQQRFFGMVRAAQKGEMKNPSKEVLDVADDISVKDAKDFAKTKHKGLPNKKEVKEGASILKVRGKRNTYMGPSGDHKRDKEGNIEASFYKKKPAPTGEKWGDKSGRPKKPSPLAVRARRKKRKEEKAAKAAGSVVQTKSGKKVNSKYEELKAKIYARDEAQSKKSREHAKKNNPNYGKSDGGRKYVYTSVNEASIEEGRLDRIMNTVRKYSKKRKAEKKPQKAMDAGARGRRILQRREYADRISGSTENVPDDIRDHYLHI